MNSLGGPLYQDICPSLHVICCVPQWEAWEAGAWPCCWCWRWSSWCRGRGASGGEPATGARTRTRNVSWTSPHLSHRLCTTWMCLIMKSVMSIVLQTETHHHTGGSRAERLRLRTRKPSGGDGRAEVRGRGSSRQRHQGTLEGAITDNTDTQTSQVDQLQS